jgi:L-alanine-DL-glutamate epimerase-like enolase superfamily enzyme
MDSIELVHIQIDTSEGVSGEGYAYTIGSGGSAIKALIDDYLIDSLLQKDPIMTEALWESMWRKIHWVGRGGLASFALAAIDVALWDIKAKVAGLPLYRLLGAYRDSIPAYGSGVDLNLSDRELLQQVEGFLKEGFRAVKIKVGRDDPSDDLRRVKLVRDSIGEESELFVDANMKWGSARAIRMGRLLEQFNIGWLEEPLIPDDIEGHRRVARALTVPIAVGESLHTKHEFHRYLAASAVDVVQLDMITVGGITEWLKVAAMAQAWNLPVSTHYGEEIQAHLLCAIPNGYIAERHAYRLDHVLANPIALRDGNIVPAAEPGHGVSFIKKKLDEYRVA